MTDLFEYGFPFIVADAIYHQTPRAELEALLIKAKQDNAPKDAYRFYDGKWIVASGGAKRQLSKLI
jgi:hypothetical protein